MIISIAFLLVPALNLRVLYWRHFFFFIDAYGCGQLIKFHATSAPLQKIWIVVMQWSIWTTVELLDRCPAIISMMQDSASKAQEITEVFNSVWKKKHFNWQYFFISVVEALSFDPALSSTLFNFVMYVVHSLRRSCAQFFFPPSKLVRFLLLLMPLLFFSSYTLGGLALTFPQFLAWYWIHFSLHAFLYDILSAINFFGLILTHFLVFVYLIYFFYRRSGKVNHWIIFKYLLILIQIIYIIKNSSPYKKSNSSTTNQWEYSFLCKTSTKNLLLSSDLVQFYW